MGAIIAVCAAIGISVAIIVAVENYELRGLLSTLETLAAIERKWCWYSFELFDGGSTCKVKSYVYEE